MMSEKVCFVGGGNMAEAMVKGLLNKQVAAADSVIVSEPREDRRRFLADMYKVAVQENNRSAVQQADIVILAVKPQVMADVLREIAPVLSTRQVIISIAAGISTSLIASLVGSDKCIIRAMPNTPAQVECGATALCGAAAATSEALALAQKLFDAIGISVVMQESHLDAVTGLSGSGPAYLFLIVEALIDGGVAMGLPRDVAQALVLQTVIGAGRMVLETGKHPSQLKDMVTSPGGTTIKGLQVLEKRGVRAALMEAVEQATQRSRELAHGVKP